MQWTLCGGIPCVSFLQYAGFLAFVEWCILQIKAKDLSKDLKGVQWANSLIQALRSFRDHCRVLHISAQHPHLKPQRPQVLPSPHGFCYFSLPRGGTGAHVGKKPAGVQVRGH